MSIVDTYESQGFVSVKNTEGEVSKPGLGIKVVRLSQNPLGLVEQRRKLRWEMSCLGSTASGDRPRPRGIRPLEKTSAVRKENLDRGVGGVEATSD